MSMFIGGGQVVEAPNTGSVVRTGTVVAESSALRAWPPSAGIASFQPRQTLVSIPARWWICTPASTPTPVIAAQTNVVTTG